MSQKTCRACDTLKDLEDFPLFSTVGAGRKNTCKACSNQLATVRSKLRKDNPPPPPGPCPACNRLTSQWVLDHCHHTDQFRGYICNSCNLGFGKFNDDPELMQQALDYLTKPQSSRHHAMQPLSREAYAAVLSENEEHDYPELATSLEETTEVDS